MSTGQGGHEGIQDRETRPDEPDDDATRLDTPSERTRPDMPDEAETIEGETRYEGAEGRTRLEYRPGDTRREDPADRDGGETRREKARQEEPSRARPLPPVLGARYRVSREFGSRGSEAHVLLVEGRDSGEELVLKLYHRERELDSDALTTLRAAAESSYQVVGIRDFGQEDGSWYEVQEYCRHGSLRSLLEDGWVDPIGLIEQLVPTLEHLEGRVFHRDLKPANVFIRSTNPLRVVIGDFGLALNADAYGTVYWAEGGTRAYQPPEAALNRVTTAWDWWSLGMILAEAALGRHPLAGGDGRLPRDASIPDRINRYSVDVSGIEDERLRTLCRGLLLRDPDRRWRAEQVAAWRGGEPVQVPVDTEPNYFSTGAAGPRGAVAPVPFAGREYSDPESLAEAFQDHWDVAREQLFVRDDHDAWRQEVAALLSSYGRRDAAEIVSHGPARVSNAHRSMAFLLLAMNPGGLRPVFNGIWLTRQGLQREASSVLERAGTAHRLAELRQARVLSAWRSLPDLMDLGSVDIDHRWQAGCSRVDELVHHLGLQAEELGQAIERAKAWLLLCAIDQNGNYARDLRRNLRNTHRSAARETDWWRTLAEEGEASQGALPAAALAMATYEIARLTPRERERQRLRDSRDGDEGRTQFGGGLGRLGGGAGFGRQGGQGATGELTPGGSPSNPLVRSVASWPRTTIMAGSLVFNLWLISRFGGDLRDVPQAVSGRVNVDLGAIDGLEQNVPRFLGLLAVFLLVQAIGLRKRRDASAWAGRGYAVLTSIVHLVMIAGILWSGWVNMLVGGVATATEEVAASEVVPVSETAADGLGSPLPEWCRSLQPFYVLLAILCALLLWRTVVVLRRAVKPSLVF